jgi:TonB family protein
MKNFLKRLPVFVSLLITLGLMSPNTIVQGQVANQEAVEQILANADSLMQMNQLREAKKEIEKALKLDKKSVEAYLLLSVAYRREGKIDEAIKQARNAVKLRPIYANGHYILAVLLFEISDVKKSEIELNLAFQQGMANSNLYVLKAHLALHQENYSLALEAFEEASHLRNQATEDTDNLSEKIVLLKNMVEFEQQKKNSAYILPKPLNRPRPEYTEDARNKGVSGTVKLRAFVDVQGDVKGCIVIWRLDRGLDAEAVKAVRALKFNPALKDNNPVPFWVTLEVSFEVRSQYQ